jgi:hypothetical protein
MRSNFLKENNMNAENENAGGTMGGCLCGKVRYKIIGSQRGIVNCHCSKCRKFHGNFGAYTGIPYANLKLLEQGSLKWYQSIHDETPNVYRGFCSECGSSLFWHPRDQERIAVAAGSLDNPNELKTIGHVWISQKSDYYPIDDDLPKFEKGWE